MYTCSHCSCSTYCVRHTVTWHAYYSVYKLRFKCYNTIYKTILSLSLTLPIPYSPFFILLFFFFSLLVLFSSFFLPLIGKNTSMAQTKKIYIFSYAGAFRLYDVDNDGFITRDGTYFFLVDTLSLATLLHSNCNNNHDTRIHFYNIYFILLAHYRDVQYCWRNLSDGGKWDIIP